MAGDWIKMRADLFTHPKVVRMASALKADKLRTVGGLMSVWCLFDAHSVDGKLDGYTFEEVDDHLRWPGFSDAMCAIGWIAKTENCLVLPEFDTHNGHSAKRRAQDADRKRYVRKTSAQEADKKRTREEKRREEKSNTGSATPTIRGVAPEETETEGFTPTQAGAICMAIKRCGVADVNPGHPRLSALIDVGATEPEFTGFARTAAEQGKGFAWVLGAVEGERKRAASMGTQLHRGPLPQPVSKQAALEARNASIVEQLKREHAA